MDGKRVKVPDEETDVVCELCGRNMVIKIGPYGKFLACPGFPECRNTKKIVTETEGSCPRCGKKMLLKKSKKGRSFYGCEGYPDCSFMTWNVPSRRMPAVRQRRLSRRAENQASSFVRARAAAMKES